MSGGRGLVICFCYDSCGVNNLTGGSNYSDFLVFKIEYLLGCTMVAASTTGLLETSKFKHQFYTFYTFHTLSTTSYKVCTHMFYSFKYLIT